MNMSKILLLGIKGDTHQTFWSNFGYIQEIKNLKFWGQSGGVER